MPDYTITIELKDVAEGDATTLAQDIWDTHADSFDAALGDFDLRVTRGDFLVDWAPST